MILPNNPIQVSWCYGVLKGAKSAYCPFHIAPTKLLKSSRADSDLRIRSMSYTGNMAVQFST